MKLTWDFVCSLEQQAPGDYRRSRRALFNCWSVFSMRKSERILITKFSLSCPSLSLWQWKCIIWKVCTLQLCLACGNFSQNFSSWKIVSQMQLEWFFFSTLNCCYCVPSQNSKIKDEKLLKFLGSKVYRIFVLVLGI